MDIRKINLEGNPLEGATDDELQSIEANLKKLGGQPAVKQGSPTDLSEKITPELQIIVDDAVEHMGQDEADDKDDSDTVEDIEKRFQGNVGANLETNRLNNIPTKKQEGLDE